MHPNTPETLAGARVLVTGASGFIGSQLCRRLREAEAEVHGISRVARSSEEGGPTWWKGDASDEVFVRKLLRALRPEFVFHLAGETRAKRDLELVLPTFQQNLTTSVNILLAATESGCRRVVLAGSLDEPVNGEVPSSPYAAAHVAIRAYARMFHEILGARAVVARIFMTYGPQQEALQKLIPYVTLALLRGEAPKVSSGERLVDWVYIDDVADGLLALGLAPWIEGRTLDVASGKPASVREVVEQLARLTGSTEEPIFGAVPERKMEQSRRANVEETFAATGWRSKTSLEEGLQKTIEWYRTKVKPKVMHSWPVLALMYLWSQFLGALEEFPMALEILTGA